MKLSTVECRWYGQMDASDLEQFWILCLAVQWHLAWCNWEHGTALVPSGTLKCSITWRSICSREGSQSGRFDIHRLNRLLQLHAVFAGYLEKLQRVINALTQVVSGTRRSDHLHGSGQATLASSRVPNQIQNPPSNRSQRANQDISPRCSIFRLHPELSSWARETVCI